MSDNKVFAILIIAIASVAISMTVFGDTSGCDDNASTKIRKEEEKTKREIEKTKQLQYQFKLDSLKALKK
jgi:hypothetical protein